MPVSGFAQVSRRFAGQDETVVANRSWWDAEAREYYAEHGSFLGDAEFTWGPEGWRESELHLLGDVAGRRVLEIGAGAGQCSRWLAAQGGDRDVEVEVVATDLSAGMLRTGVDLNSRVSDPRQAVPLAQCDATALPFADGSFDVVFTAYGAVPFVADSALLVREAARVLRPGGALVLEVHEGHADAVASLFQAHGFADVRTTADLTGRDRVVEGRSAD